MTTHTQEASKPTKLKVDYPRWPEEFPEVQLTPNIKGHLDARSWLSGSGDEEEEDGKRHTGHVHSFSFDFDNSERGYIHVCVSDLDGLPLTEAVKAFEEMQSQLSKAIEELINIPSGNYPYPPAGWGEEAIAANMKAWLEDARGMSRNRRTICEGVTTSERPQHYAVDEAGKPIEESRGHIHEACIEIKGVGHGLEWVPFDDRNGTIEKQTADYLKGMIANIQAVLEKVEAAKPAEFEQQPHDSAKLAELATK